MIVAGFGFRAAAGVASLDAALALACEAIADVGADGAEQKALTQPSPAKAGEGSRSPPVADALAAPADKLPALRPLAARLGVPLIAVAPEALARAATHASSAASLAARGTGSVAEAAALVAAGFGARLIAPRRLTPDGMAACALAEGSGG